MKHPMSETGQMKRPLSAGRLAGVDEAPQMPKPVDVCCPAGCQAGGAGSTGACGVACFW